MIKKTSIALLIAALWLSGCTKMPKEATILLDHDHFTVSAWKHDGSQVETIKGKLLLDQAPVENASIRIGEKKTLKTDKNGEFSFTVDTSAISEKNIKVNSLDNAKKDGIALNEKEKQLAQAQEKTVSVYFPIKVVKEEKDPNNAEFVIVDAQLGFDKDMKFPTPRFDSYVMKGIVKDSKGNPVRGAVVNTVRSATRDVGEGFNQSKPSGEDGSYTMLYLPESGEETQLRVTVGDIQYKLPQDKYFYFPEGTSSHIDITLPENSTIIDDKPPTLVAKTYPGANYKGVLIGIVVHSEAQITIPDTEGHFQVKVKKDIWNDQIRFYETMWSGFSDVELKGGDVLPKNVIQLPKTEEPKDIAVSR
jgi:hypothetical protein